MLRLLVLLICLPLSAAVAAQQPLRIQQLQRCGDLLGDGPQRWCLRVQGLEQGKPAVRTTVYFTHGEMAHLLADYRAHHPIEGQSWNLRLSGPQASWWKRAKRFVDRCLVSRK